MKKFFMPLLATLAVTLYLIGFSPLAFADGIPGRNDENPNPPTGGTALLMANGIYNPADPSFTPPTPDEFDTLIMGRSETEKLERKQLAIGYFQARYGIDLTSGSADFGNILLMESVFDPRNNYRAYHLPISARDKGKIAKNGRIVYDRQFVMFVGALGLSSTLTGSWGGALGITVPPGTVAVDGDYLVQGSNHFRINHPRNLYLRFQSVDPIFNAASGDIKFNCVLLNKHGEIIGAAIGRQEFVALDIGNNLFQMAVQNIWQFPAPEWALP
ncbi:hypothetical protein ACL7TT_05355 [Microbulbifer sp. 2304DJ12-6]|uniref:hypothetical protein n=1 Tax=Microbulbifer sp. 2304DJ12-6 TaxID=3233340 RepID=UPI0039B0C919